VDPLDQEPKSPGDFVRILSSNDGRRWYPRKFRSTCMTLQHPLSSPISCLRIASGIGFGDEFISLFVVLIFDSKSLQNNVLPRRVTASWCQRIFPLSPALPPRSTSAARHHYHHGTNHRHRVAKEVRSQASCSRTVYTSAYTFAVGSDHPPTLSPHNSPIQMLLESRFSFCTQQVTTRLHSGEAATAGEDGVNRTMARKSGQAAPAGGHHGGPRGATPSSQPGYPRALTGWDYGSPGGGAAPTLCLAAAQMTRDKKESVTSSSHEVLRLRPLAGVFS
jgi:hypothetical protein